MGEFEWGVSTNATGVAGALEDTQEEAPEQQRKAQLRICAKILKRAKRNAPVKSGALKASGRLEELPTSNNEYSMILISFGGPGTEVGYATYVEFGTSFQAGQFFLMRAVDKYASQLAEANLSAIEGVWNGNAVVSNSSRLV